MKILGRNQIFWDEMFMRFLKITDSRVIALLNGQEIKEEKDEYQG